MKIPYLSERKMKALIKRMREKSIKLCRGLYRGSGAGAPATLSSVQGVSRHGRVCCRCDAGRCAAGHRSGTTPAQTALVLKALGRNEAFPTELDPAQGPYTGCRLPQCTDFTSWDLDVKDSSPDHVRPRLRAEVYTRSGVLGAGVPPTTGFLTHAGKFGAVLGKGPPQQAAAGQSISCFRIPEGRHKRLAKPWSRRRALQPCRKNQQL